MRAITSALACSLSYRGPAWGPAVVRHCVAAMEGCRCRSPTTACSRIAGAFTAKWDGRWQFTASGGCFRDSDGRGGAMVFSVTPVKVFAHAKGDTFGATRHKFGLPGDGADSR